MELIKLWIDHLFMWLTEFGYWGIVLGLMVEVIPSEIVLSYGGFLVSQGHITFVGAVICGVIGGTAAQLILYWIGRYGGRPFLEKYGKYILISKKHIDYSEQWFQRYGPGMIFFARFIPVVRHAISIPAGIAKMPLLKFTFLTALAVIPWSVLFIGLGMALGENWRSIDEKAGPYVVPIIGTAAALALIYFMIQAARRKKGRAHHGLAGEKITAHQLKFIGKEYVVLHHRFVRWEQSGQEFDHIVVGPNGVFHIESKHWAGEIRFTPDGVVRDQSRDGGDPTGQMYRHEYVLKNLLERHQFKTDVVGIICFTHPQARVSGKSPAFAAVTADRLLHVIKTHRPKYGRLTPQEVRRIADLVREHSVNSRIS